MKGHNYELPDCIVYILERRSREEFDFWDIAALTGDTMAHVYHTKPSTFCGYCVSGYLAGEKYVTSVFDRLGYSSEYVPYERLTSERTVYTKKITESIDSGVPILVKTGLKEFFPNPRVPENPYDVLTYCLAVGYEISGDEVKLQLLTVDTEELECVIGDGKRVDLIFVGEMERKTTPRDILLLSLRNAAKWLTHPSCGSMFFGFNALRTWAGDIRAGRFTDEKLDCDWWGNWGVYVCNIATSGGQIAALLKKASLSDETYAFLADIAVQVDELFPAENPYGAGRCLLWLKLEEMGVGMDMDSVKKTLSDPKMREQAARTLEDFADRVEKIARIMAELEDRL